MSRILVFQHSDECGPGRMGRVLADHGRRLVIVRPDREGAGVVPRDLHDIEGVVSLGGPMNISDGIDWLHAEIAFLKRAHEASIPMVGICLGHQAIATALGGAVAAMDKPEVGFWPIDLSHAAQNDPVFGGMPWSAPRFSSHGYEVTDLPPGRCCWRRRRRARSSRSGWARGRTRSSTTSSGPASRSATRTRRSSAGPA